MPAPESFANIVDTLAGVRQDYHEKLKSIPQYEAFLLIESSTEKAAGALHGTEASSSSIATDVIDSLQYARTRFEQHMASIPEYRVLMAIDKVIKEISQHLGLAAAADDAVAETSPATTEVQSVESADTVAQSEPEDEQVPEPEDDADTTPEPVAADAPTLRVVETQVKSPSIVPADRDADTDHDDDIVVLNAPGWEKGGRDAGEDITARLAAQAASAAANATDDGHDVADADLVIVSQREPADHEAA
ncbi:hypothetical protein LQG66_05430 [Bradyrhizobium ontarionense]|uniref:Uncharacterized protein n=1 Tax=Bradyrhizobium ontarionense TaxID=2898149 RepID=A0ABY3RG11_9BRAD|nr:hypothetical protein [Bradyrhizobium sp. A19]UFZ05756.1 hypothetical protein LQG66_05430 [Bradyrhizobium sp. A19]